MSHCIAPASNVTAVTFICIYSGMTAHPSVVTPASQSILSQLVAHEPCNEYRVMAARASYFVS